jgi:hypothetical protein
VLSLEIGDIRVGREPTEDNFRERCRGICSRLRRKHGVASGSRCRHRKIIDLLIDKGAELDAVDQHGHTPLHRSAWLGYGVVMRL